MFNKHPSASLLATASVAAVAFVAATAQADIVLVNGDFSSATLNSAGAPGVSTSIADAGWYTRFTGLFDLSTGAAVRSDSSPSNDTLLTQIVTDNKVSTGHYRLLFDINQSHDSADYFFDVLGTNSSPSTNIDTDSPTFGSDWTQFASATATVVEADGVGTLSLDFTIAEPGFDFIAVRVGTTVVNGPGSDTTAIDNVRIALVPEPASLSLLGLAGLWMLGRSRPTPAVE